MISVEHGFTLLHFPKTGGNSLHHCLFSFASFGIEVGEWNQNGDGVAFHYDGHKQGKHHSLMQRFDWLGSRGEDPSRFVYFSSTRNPWDMLLSRYLFYNHLQHLDIDGWNSWLLGNIERMARKFDEFYQNPHDVELVYLKMETLAEDLENKIVQRFGLQLTNSLGHSNKSRVQRAGYHTYYTDATRRLVAEHFETYIKLHNYDF